MIYSWHKGFFFQKYSVWRFKYTWHLTSIGLLILTLNFISASFSLCSSRAVTFLGLLCCYFCLCYYHFCSICDSFACFPFLATFLISYLIGPLSCFLSLLTSTWKDWPFKYITIKPEDSFPLVGELINHSSFAIITMSLALLSHIQNAPISQFISFYKIHIPPPPAPFFILHHF